MFQSSSSGRASTQRSSYAARFLIAAATTALAGFYMTIHAQQSDLTVAKVEGIAISQQQLDDTIATQLFPLQQQIFALRKTALDNFVNHLLMEREAKRRGLTLADFIKQITANPVNVSPTQVEDLYQQNIEAFGLMSADEARQKLRLDLEAQARLKNYRDAVAKLREAAQVQLMLDEPRLNAGEAPAEMVSKGPRTAPVVVREFSDFQCPYCKEVQDVIARLLKEYPTRVRLVFTNLPLDIHSQSFPSARAAYCAGKQGRFWDYHDALFASRNISPDFFQRLSEQLGLNTVLFEKCLGSDESNAAVLADLQEARRLGIAGTPTFIVNGRVLRGAQTFDAFKTLIEEELSRAKN
ncbi:MAG: thioredoxin domain-containing protein [Pyrinomonadaceae bacterium]